MKHRWNKFLAAFLSFALLLSTIPAISAAPAQETVPDPLDITNFSEADFTGTMGPDNLDAIYPRAQARVGSTTDFTDIKNIVVLVNFNGMDEFITPQRMQTANQIYNVRDDSLKGYLDHLTYGQINVDSSFYPENADGTGYISYTDPHPIEYYKPYSDTNTQGYSGNTQRFAREHELVTGAFNYVKAQVEADYTGAQLDNNNDGLIDSLAFIVNGYRGTGGGIAWNDLLWPHKTSMNGLFMNGKQINYYNILLADIPPSGDGGLIPVDVNNATFGVVIHEFLHTLGFPDLYHYYSTGNPVGVWDIMASTAPRPQNMLQYMQREYMGFGKPIHRISQSGTYTLQAPQYVNADVDGGYAEGSNDAALIIRSGIDQGEYFVIEYRKNTGFDAALPGSGLLIYRINPSVSGGNANGPRDYLYMFRPGETSEIACTGNTSYAYFSQQSGRTSIGKAIGTENAGFDNGTLFLASGKNSGIIIDQISASGGDTMSFRVTITLPNIEGEGTEANPYLIQHPYQMDYLHQFPDKYFKMTTDIVYQTQDGTFTPVSNFTGTLDGANHQLRNVVINSAGSAQAGIFETLGASGIVKDLTIKNMTVTSGGNAGLVAGTLAGTVQNLTVESGSVTSTGAGFAGMVCGVAESTASITNAMIKRGTNVSGNTAGGLAGKSESAAWNNCVTCAEVTGTGDTPATGGIFGKQVVNASYTAAQRLFWDVRNSTQTVGAQVEKPADATVTGLEGIVGIKLSDITVGAGAQTQAVVETIPADAQIPTGGGFGGSTWSEVYSMNSSGLITGLAPGVGEGYYYFPYLGMANAIFYFEVTTVTLELSIVDLSIIQGTPTVGSNVTFRAACGGTTGQEYFAYYLFRDGQLCYSAKNVFSNTFSYQLQAAGNYTLVCYCSNRQNGPVSKSLQFTVPAA